MRYKLIGNDAEGYSLYTKLGVFSRWEYYAHFRDRATAESKIKLLANPKYTHYYNCLGDRDLIW